MDRYHLGQDVPLGAPIKTVNRVEAVRPDGSVLQHDWDTRVSRVHADQVGRWSWRRYLREGNTTRLEAGEFEVLPASATGNPAARQSRITRMIRRHWNGR